MSLLFWIYVVNATLLINHEIDSAYWQEWKLLNPDDRNGINGFLLLHFPMILFVLLGLVMVYKQSPTGYIMSLILAAGGIFAFVFHYYHLRKGRPEFNTVLSKSIIIATFIVSVFQLVLTLKQMTA